MYDLDVKIIFYCLVKVVVDLQVYKRNITMENTSEKKFDLREIFKEAVIKC